MIVQDDTRFKPIAPRRVKDALTAHGMRLVTDALKRRTGPTRSRGDTPFGGAGASASGFAVCTGFEG